MPVFALDDSFEFPDPRYADPEGLLAVGGDLDPRRLISAYALGIFPWFEEGSPLLWWSPDPRLILVPHEMKVTKSLKQSIRTQGFHFSSDKAFGQVIRHCASTPRQDGGGTWITGEMIQAYTKLHEMGVAHSIETWLGDTLVGGLYGVSLGRAFFGESMFFLVRDASKAALWTLCQFLEKIGFHFIDAQMHTEHLVKMGAKELKREDFLNQLDLALEYQGLIGKWTGIFEENIEVKTSLKL